MKLQYNSTPTNNANNNEYVTIDLPARALCTAFWLHLIISKVVEHCTESKGNLVTVLNRLYKAIVTIATVRTVAKMKLLLELSCIAAILVGAHSAVDINPCHAYIEIKLVNSSCEIMTLPKGFCGGKLRNNVAHSNTMLLATVLYSKDLYSPLVRTITRHSTACPFGKLNSDGHYVDCEKVQDLENAPAICFEKFQEYVDMNPCDEPRAAALLTYLADDTSDSDKDFALKQLDFFYYAFCEAACDCIPQIGATRDTKTVEYTRGNCQAHPWYVR